MALYTKRIWHEDDAYFRYRIPGMVITPSGTRLLYCEARRDFSDWAHMDVLLYRADVTDPRETLPTPERMACGTDEHPTVNNPVCIVGKDGTLHFLYCEDYATNGGGVLYRTSTDDGITWSAPQNIFASTRPDYHNVFALGPGHGIATADGTLLVPVWMVPKAEGRPIDSHHPAVVSTLYSQDNGKTWQLGEILPPTETVPDPNETEAAVTPDGEVYLNVRSTGAGYRACSWSKTGTSGWSPLTLDHAFPDPTCMGSVARYSANGIEGILAVNCADPKERKNLTCRFSPDGGHHWTKSLVIDPGDAGYADTAVHPDGTIYVLYEKRGGEEDWLASFTLDDMV